MHQEVAQEPSPLEGSLAEAVRALAAIAPCPFAAGRPLDSVSHIDHRAPECPAHGLRRRKARPFVDEMRRFVEERREDTPTVSWDALVAEWNSGHEMHRYTNANSMREAYGNASRRRGRDPVPDLCRTCVLEELRRRSRARSEGG